MDEKTTVINFTAPVDYQALAVEKLAKELETFNGDRYGNVVKDFVASTLKHFCQQDKRFAEVVYKTSRTLSDCCAEIMKGCKTHASDIDVYRGAVKSYFPNAEIDFTMRIAINGDMPTEEEMARVPEKEPATKTKQSDSEPAEEDDEQQQEIVAAKPNTPKKPVPVKKVAVKPKPEPEIIQLSLF